MNALVRFALRQRVLVLALAVLALGGGLWTAAHLPVDVFPDLNRPTVTIMTEAGGLSPEEVEVQVTRPIELAISGAPGVERMRSSSAVGLSIVWVEFGWATTPLVNRQLVAERLTVVARELPAGVTPEMGPLTSIMGEIMLVGLVQKDEVAAADGSAADRKPAGLSSAALRTLAEYTVRRQLLAVPGIAQVIAIGGGREVVRIALDPARMAQFGVTHGEVAAALAASEINTSGGFLERQNQEWLVRNIARSPDVATAMERAADIAVAPRGDVVIRLGQVATISLGPDVKRGDAGVDGKPAVVLSVQKQPGASTTELSEQLEQRFVELRKHLPAGVELVPLFRQADFIEASNTNVEEALRDGAALVAIVLFLFLLNVRTTAITLTAIPLSLAVTAIVFSLMGMTVNTMTLGGIAVAIGELVDDAIVDVENVFRRLRESRSQPSPEHPLLVIWRASVEVRGSIVFATLLVILVFVPLFALSGIEGRLFAPLGIAYIVSILSSLLVSVTVTPALCSFLLPRAEITRHTRDGFLVRGLKRAQRWLLGHTLAHPFAVLGAALVLVTVAIAALPFFGREFLPPFNEGTATINLLAAPGTALETSNALGAAAEKLLLAVPEVKSVGRRTGRAEEDEHAEGVHYTEIDVDFAHADDLDGAVLRPRAEVLADIRERLAVLPGVVVNLGQPISHRLDHLLSGVRAQIAVKVFGPDLGALRSTAAAVEAAAKTVPGLVDVQVEKQVLIPQLQLRILPERAARYGFTPGALATRLGETLAGETAGLVIEGDKSFRVWLRLGDEARSEVESIARTLIDTPSGVRAPLEALAEVRLERGPNTIVHENGARRIAVSANVQERDLGSAVRELEERVQAIPLGPEQHIAFEGQFQSEQAATELIAWLALLSLAGMILVLWMHFGRMALVAQVLLNIPLALVGSVAALAIAGLPFSVATLVGFITLCGIASRNSILLIDHYLVLAAEGGAAFTTALIARGSTERLVPVLMTALTAGLGLIPLVLSADAPGKEILHPVAVVILGGLISSTLLDLFVTPAAFWLYGRRAVEARAKAQDPFAPFASLVVPPSSEPDHV